MLNAYELDLDGFIKDNYLFKNEDDVSEGFVITPLPQPLLYLKPKWTGLGWVEGKSQEEINEENTLATLMPSAEEIANAEFEIKILNILMEVELL